MIEQDGKLYVVVSAENIHPGKGTPVSQIEMRRISDGGKDLRTLQDHRPGRKGHDRRAQLHLSL
ncbi:translation elongation factor P/translation initiation factor 5A [Bradyrhizobium liaoningense]